MGFSGSGLGGVSFERFRRNHQRRPERRTRVGMAMAMEMKVMLEVGGVEVVGSEVVVVVGVVLGRVVRRGVLVLVMLGAWVGYRVVYTGWKERVEVVVDRNWKEGVVSLPSEGYVLG